MSRRQNYGDEDLYEVLQISPEASVPDIKKAYHAFAKKFHPDLNPGDKNAEEAFKRVTHAYAILVNPRSRKEYDEHWQFTFGRMHSSMNNRGHAAFGRRRGRTGTKIRPGMDDDISEHFDAEEWRRAHYGPSDADKARAAADYIKQAEQRGWSGHWEDPNRDWKQNFERRRMAQAAAAARTNASKAAMRTPKPRGFAHALPVVAVLGIAAGLVAFDQYTKRVRAHDIHRRPRLHRHNGASSSPLAAALHQPDSGSDSPSA